MRSAGLLAPSLTPLSNRGAIGARAAAPPPPPLEVPGRGFVCRETDAVQFESERGKGQRGALGGLKSPPRAQPLARQGEGVVAGPGSAGRDPPSPYPCISHIDWTLQAVRVMRKVQHQRQS